MRLDKLRVTEAAFPSVGQCTLVVYQFRLPLPLLCEKQQPLSVGRSAHARGCQQVG